MYADISWNPFDAPLIFSLLHIDSTLTNSFANHLWHVTIASLPYNYRAVERYADQQLLELTMTLPWPGYYRAPTLSKPTGSGPTPMVTSLCYNHYPTWTVILITSKSISWSVISVHDHRVTSPWILLKSKNLCDRLFSEIYLFNRIVTKALKESVHHDITGPRIKLSSKFGWVMIGDDW